MWNACLIYEVSSYIVYEKYVLLVKLFLAYTLVNDVSRHNSRMK